MALKGNTNAEKIWNYLFGKGLPECAVFGLVGNMYAESGLLPNNLQDSYEKRLGYTDATYTAAVDNGAYRNFASDAAGYGLCQWTSAARKQGLYDLAESNRKSIADMETQLDWLWKELCSPYKSVLDGIMSSASIRAASDIILTKFERPADQGEKAKVKRASHGKRFQDEYRARKSVLGITPVPGTGPLTLVSNCGADERGKLSGGVAGDQTGKEWCIRNWYARPWKCVLRHPDPNVGALLADLAKRAALNEAVGYDQGQRDTYWKQLRKAGYDPSAITVPCGADCSSGVVAHVLAAGYLLGNIKLQKCRATFTGDMRAALNEAGFEVLTGAEYLESSNYLLAGDILLNDGVHAATNLTDGARVSAGDGGKVAGGKAPVYRTGETYATQAELRVRTGPGTNYLSKRHEQLTPDGRKHDADRDGALDPGTRVTCKQVAYDGADIWIRTPSGWLAAYYKGNVYIR